MIIVGGDTWKMDMESVSPPINCKQVITICLFNEEKSYEYNIRV